MIIEDIKKRMGWIKEEFDARNFNMDSPKVKQFYDKLRVKTLPIEVDLRPQMSPVKDQGNLGSCTANAVSSAIEALEIKMANKYDAVSRLFVYYNTRHFIENSSGDTGATITDTIQSTRKYGACFESQLPYDISKFDSKPSQACYDSALNYQTLTYVTLNNLTDIQTNLGGGIPIPIGILVFASFENVTSNGIVPMPNANEKLLGGHAVLVCGYKTINNIQYLIVKNSWGTSWGDNGYFYLPVDYLNGTYYDKQYGYQKYADDFKAILTEEYIKNTPVVITPNVPQAISDAKTAYKQTSITKAKPYINNIIKELGD